MVTICLQCGVKGWSNAFVYCVKCLNEAVHRYCLDEVPKTYEEFVPWVCDVCDEELQKRTPSKSDAKTQGKTCSEQIEVDFTITLNKKRISHLVERVHNGEGLQFPHKELDSSNDAKTQGKRHSEQIEVDSTITLKKKKKKKKRISHSAQRVENHQCENGAGPHYPHKELESIKDDKTQEKTCSEQIEVDPTTILDKKVISHLIERVENGDCKNGAVLQSPYKESDSIKGAKTQKKRCLEQTEGDSTITPKKKRISHLTKRVENGHCKDGAELQSPHKGLDSSEDPKTQGKACSEQIEVDSTITLDKKGISHLTERVEIGAGLQSSHKEPGSSKGAELVSQYRPSRAGTNSIDDCSRMVLMNNKPRSPTNSSELLQKAKKVEGVANGLPKKAKLRKLNDLSLVVTTNQSRSSDSAECDEDVPLVSLSPLATDREIDISCTLDNCDEQTCENVPALQPHKQGRDNNYGREAEPMEERSEASTDKNDAECISQSPMKAQPIVAADENILRAKPLVDPVWRGNFDILNEDDIIEGLSAHLSSKACRMVYNEASLLPMSLQLKLLPKDVVWPKSFEKSDPTDDNIAMYIFATDPRYTSSFDLLVSKMTKQELAMKAVTKNAELLIFTSTELPLSYWRFRDKCYLWGVFRGKPSLLSSRATGDPVVPM